MQILYEIGKRKKYCVRHLCIVSAPRFNSTLVHV
jgi:hypothetical protein